MVEYGRIWQCMVECGEDGTVWQGDLFWGIYFSIGSYLLLYKHYDQRHASKSLLPLCCRLTLLGVWGGEKHECGHCRQHSLFTGAGEQNFCWYTKLKDTGMLRCSG